MIRLFKRPVALCSLVCYILSSNFLFSQSSQNRNVQTQYLASSKALIENLDQKNGVLIYCIDNKQVKVIGEFDYYDNCLNEPQKDARIALVNELLINLLRQGYFIDALDVVPIDNTVGSKLCIGMRKRDENQY
jgi:hypothetical protein